MDSHSNPAERKDITNSTKVQAEANKGSVWSRHPPRPETLKGRVAEQIGYYNEVLSEKERLKLCYIAQKIHSSYYRNWVEDSNAIFRAAVRLRYRSQRL